jgi:hypothetical protein
MRPAGPAGGGDTKVRSGGLLMVRGGNSGLTSVGGTEGEGGLSLHITW